MIDVSQADLQRMDAAAGEAAELLKVLSNPQRLRLLCAMVPGPQSVSALEAHLGASQSYVSGQLAKMRQEGVIRAEREGRIIRYSLCDERLTPILSVLYDVFCPTPVQEAVQGV